MNTLGCIHHESSLFSPGEYHLLRDRLLKNVHPTHASTHPRTTLYFISLNFSTVDSTQSHDFYFIFQTNGGVSSHLRNANSPIGYIAVPVVGPLLAAIDFVFVAEK